MTHDAQITAAALRWFTARQRRMAIGAEQRQYQKEGKALTGFGGADWDISHRHQQVKPLELQAAKTLAKVCEQQRCHLSRADDASLVPDVFEVASNADSPTHFAKEQPCL